MLYSLVVRALGLEYGGRELESRSLHLKPETKLREERGLSGCTKGLKTVPLAQALLSLKPLQNQQRQKLFEKVKHSPCGRIFKFGAFFSFPVHNLLCSR